MLTTSVVVALAMSVPLSNLDNMTDTSKIQNSERLEFIHNVRLFACTNFDTILKLAFIRGFINCDSEVLKVNRDAIHDTDKKTKMKLMKEEFCNSNMTTNNDSIERCLKINKSKISFLYTDDCNETNTCNTDITIKTNQKIYNNTGNASVYI